MALLSCVEYGSVQFLRRRQLDCDTTKSSTNSFHSKLTWKVLFPKRRIRPRWPQSPSSPGTSSMVLNFRHFFFFAISSDAWTRTECSRLNIYFFVWPYTKGANNHYILPYEKIKNPYNIRGCMVQTREKSTRPSNYVQQRVP